MTSVIFIDSELLPFSDGDMLRDGFIGMVIIRAMYDESFSVYQFYRVNSLQRKLRLLFQLWENLLAGKGIYVHRVNVFVEEALGLKSSQIPIYSVIYLTKVRHLQISILY